MAITQEQAAQAKAIVSGWDPDTQAKFKERYKSADTAGKEKAINNILAKYGSQTDAAPSQQLEQPTNAEPRTSPLPAGLGLIHAATDPRIALKDQLMATGRNQMRDLSGMASGATLGLARPAIKSATGKDIGEGSLVGRIAGSFAPVGMAGKVIGSAAKTAPMALRAGQAALRMGAEGAAGALGSTSEESFKEYLRTAPMKAGVGAVGGVAIGAGANLARAVASPIANVIKKLPSDIKTVITKSEPALRKESRTIQGAIDAERAAGRVQQIDYKNQAREELKRLGTDFSNAIKRGGRGIQEKTVENLKKVSPKYGAMLQEELSKATGSVSREEAVSIAQNTLDEMASRGIKNTKLEEALAKYIDDFKATKTSPMLDQFGRPVVTELREAGEAIPIQELLGRRTGIMSNLSTKAVRSGEYSQQDLAAIIFDKNMTDALSPHIPGLKAIRGEYAQFKKLATELYKVVRPKSGEYNTKAVEGLIKRVTTGKASQGEIDLVKAIESGNTLLPGSGKFYVEAEDAAKLLEDFKVKSPIELSNIVRDSQMRIAALASKRKLTLDQIDDVKMAWNRLKVAGALVGAGSTVGAGLTIKKLTE